MDSFHARARCYIEKLIRQRTYLNKHHLSHGDMAVFETEIRFLKLHLTVNGYHSDSYMAGFWMRHHHKISCLIPGPGCTSAVTLYREFDRLKAEAEQITSSNDFSQPNIYTQKTSYECVQGF